MKVEVEISDPPDGWVYDGYRSPKSGEMYWDGYRWSKWFSLPVSWKAFVAIQKSAPQQPPKELVDAILLLFGDGWIFRDGNTFWTSHKPNSYYGHNDEDGVQTGWTPGDRHRVLNVRIPADIDWKDSVFKIGEPKQ